MISNIQKYSIHDGTGIRTNVFFKQCPLRCFWCANPENQVPQQELMYYENKCIRCHECIRVCQEHVLSADDNGYIQCDRDRCTMCGKCGEECVKNAIRRSGKLWTTQEVFKKCSRDYIFYQNSGGGVTFSGGEPLCFGSFCEELLEKCLDHSIGVIFETCGFGPKETLLKYAQYADRIFFDVKHYNSEKHKESTGVSNEIILDNLHSLTSVYSHTVVRVPVIPTFNDTHEEMREIARLIAATVGEMGIEYVELLPFHNLGGLKYQALCKEDQLKDYKNMSKDHIREYMGYFEDLGLTCVVE